MNDVALYIDLLNDASLLKQKSKCQVSNLEPDFDFASPSLIIIFLLDESLGVLTGEISRL